VPRQRSKQRPCRSSPVPELSPAAFGRADRARRGVYELPREQTEHASWVDPRRMHQLPPRPRAGRRARTADVRDLSRTLDLTRAPPRVGPRKMRDLPRDDARAASVRSGDMHDGLSRQSQRPPSDGAALHGVPRFRTLRRAASP